MRFIDTFCGVGGFAAGAQKYAEPVVGIDIDDQMVRLWAANTGGHGKFADAFSEQCMTLWKQYERDTHIHLSPPCTTLSKANYCRNTERKEI